MTTLQWEYCELALSDWKNRGKGFSYELYIKYYGPDNWKHLQISEVEGRNAKVLDYNPFSKAMSQLGAGGWEIVQGFFCKLDQVIPRGFMVRLS